MASLRAKITNQLRAQFGFPQTQAVQIMNLVIDTIAREICTNESTTLAHVGRWRMYMSSPMRKLFPLTGKIIEVPARKRVRFKASAKMLSTYENG